MPLKKDAEIPILRVRKGATTKEILAARRQTFTAEELMRYLEVNDEQLVPAEDVLAEMEAIHRRELAKMQKAKSTRKTRR